MTRGFLDPHPHDTPSATGLTCGSTPRFAATEIGAVVLMCSDLDSARAVRRPWSGPPGHDEVAVVARAARGIAPVLLPCGGRLGYGVFLLRARPRPRLYGSWCRLVRVGDAVAADELVFDVGESVEGTLST